MRQRGMVLMALLSGLVLGSMVWLIGTLENVVQLNQREQRSARALGEVKRVLLGRAAMDTSLPGSLPCPDSNGDGSADLLAGNDCPSYLGRVPYRTLGIPEPLDGEGEILWYALSRNFRDDDSNVINSDRRGDLNLGGVRNEAGVVALLFAPGAALPGQSRASGAAPCVTTDSTLPGTLCAANYLEDSNARLNTRSLRNLEFRQLVRNPGFNDQILPIQSGELLQLTGQRIAREIKSCLDDYAGVSSGRYPWAAAIADIAGYRATVSRYYGRIPAQPCPLVAELADAGVSALLDALAALQFALDRLAASNTIAHRNVLRTAGQVLVAQATTIGVTQPPALPPDVTGAASATGLAAQELAKTPANSTVTIVRTLLQGTLAGLAAAGVPLAAGMSIAWPASCNPVAASYWNHWRNEVFYQVAAGAQPGGSGCLPGSTCLAINGSGDYRAVVLVAGPALVGQIPRRAEADPPASWLEGANLHAAPATGFVSYRRTEAAAAQVNDLVQCLDGKIRCP
jgi:hypothetical protein